MKTTVMNYAKTLDEVFPDVTFEYAVDKCNKIHKNVKATFECAVLTAWAGSAAIVETAELSVSIIKTGGKKVAKEFIKAYMEYPPTMTIRR